MNLIDPRFGTNLALFRVEFARITSSQTGH